uniref:Uncharacterized protein n=1 Tax=Anguilla anguilla TaxID=7936 RepID=A0A0E9RAB0_ANGAN
MYDAVNMAMSVLVSYLLRLPAKVPFATCKTNQNAYHGYFCLDSVVNSDGACTFPSVSTKLKNKNGEEAPLLLG